MVNDELREKILSSEECFLDIIGQVETKNQLKSALLVNRHVIISGSPGIGKTTLAKNVASILPDMVVNQCGYNCDPEKPICSKCKPGDKTYKSTGMDRFVRIQGSPDLTAEDLLGDIDPIKALKYGPMAPEAFTPGKIFLANNGVLFFDEVNRCPERLQNAMLQVLEEGEATIGSFRKSIPSKFIFIGTMNPRDSSTEKLSEVFLDRFDVVTMSYPETVEIEEKIVLLKGKKLAEFPHELLQYSINFVRLLRHSKKVERAPSVRATIGLYERAQANALIGGRNKVNDKDIMDAIISVLAHRMELKPSVKYAMTPEEFLKEEMKAFSEKGDYR